MDGLLKWFLIHYFVQPLSTAWGRSTLPQQSAIQGATQGAGGRNNRMIQTFNYSPGMVFGNGSTLICEPKYALMSFASVHLQSNRLINRRSPLVITQPSIFKLHKWFGQRKSASERIMQKEFAKHWNLLCEKEMAFLSASIAPCGSLSFGSLKRALILN